MLSIKQLYNKLFHKNQITDKSVEKFDTDSVVLSVGLTPNYEIDLSLEIKDLLIKDNDDLEFKAQKLANFFHTISSGGLNNIIIEFLMKEIADEQNKKLFDSIIYNWLLLDKYKEQQSSSSKKNHCQPLILPSKVFSSYFPSNK